MGQRQVFIQKYLTSITV